MDDQPKNSLIEVRVRGDNPKLWKEKRSEFMMKLRDKAADTLEKVMSMQIDPIRNTTVKQELDQIVSSGLSYIKGNLAKPGADIEKTFAEVQKIYTQIERESVEIRKANAEATRSEFKNEIVQLRWSLGATKILLAGDEDEEAILFIKEIEEWTELIEQVNNML